MKLCKCSMFTMKQVNRLPARQYLVVGYIGSQSFGGPSISQNCEMITVVLFITDKNISI